jgi:hypothetical protein
VTGTVKEVGLFATSLDTPEDGLIQIPNVEANPAPDVTIGILTWPDQFSLYAPTVIPIIIGRFTSTLTN